MMNDPSGRAYEVFVTSLQQAILLSDAITTQQNILVQRDKRIKGKSGRARQFDVYWEYELGGITYRTIIECRDHSRPLSIDQIDGLAGKMRDFPGIRAAMATSAGYQSGARDMADEYDIDLLIVRRHKESDWDNLDDNFARIRFLTIEIVLVVPPRIVGFHPVVDGKWVKENTSLDTSEPMNINDLNTEVYVEEDGEDPCSLLEIANKLEAPDEGPSYGNFEKTVNMKNGFLVYKDHRLKLLSYRVEYSVHEPFREKIEIDIAEQIVGVVEYLQKGSKKSVLRNGVIWDDELTGGGSGQ